MFHTATLFHGLADLMVCSTMGLQGRRQCQVGAESTEKTPTWTGQRPQAADGAAEQVAAPGGSRNAGKDSYLDGTQAADGAAEQVAAPGRSGIDGKGSHLDGKQAADAAAGHTPLPGGSGIDGKGSYLDRPMRPCAAGVPVRGKRSKHMRGRKAASAVRKAHAGSRGTENGSAAHGG